MYKVANRNLVRPLMVVAMVAIISAPAAVNAQDVATGSATATVLTVLAVSSTAALAFGNIYQGVATTIGNGNAAAGIFTITGQGSAGIDIYMALPDYVALANGSDRMTIGFSTTDASVDSLGGGDPTAMVGASGWQNIDPHNFPSATVIGSGGTDNIYLGGTVTPTVDQAAGAYTADIILTVAYNGT